MKQKVFALLTVLMSFAVAALMSSCDKNFDEPVALSEQHQIEDSSLVQLRANQITESRGIDEDILRHFKHHSQQDNAEGAGDYCSPTSFMMSVACLLNYHNAWNKFAVSRQKLSEFAQVGVPGAEYDNVDQEDFVEGVYSNIDVDVYRLNDRTLAKSMIEYGLRNNKFVIVSARTLISRAGQDRFFTTDDSRNYDLRLPLSNANSLTNRYVLDHGGTSHALIILRIDKWSTGNGIVTYIDPYPRTKSGSNRKYCLYSHLMNSMDHSSLGYDAYTFSLVGYAGD